MRSRRATGRRRRRSCPWPSARARSPWGRVAVLPAAGDLRPFRHGLAQVARRRLSRALEEVLALDVARHDALEQRQRQVVEEDQLTPEDADEDLAARTPGAADDRRRDSLRAQERPQRIDRAAGEVGGVLEQRRVDRGRHQRADVDAFAADLVAQTFGEAAERELRGHVRARVPGFDARVHRPDVDQRAAAAAAQRRQRRASALTQPKKFVSTTSHHRSAGASSKRPSSVTPALLTHMSMPPKRFSASPARRWTAPRRGCPSAPRAHEPRAPQTARRPRSAAPRGARPARPPRPPSRTPLPSRGRCRSRRRNDNHGVASGRITDSTCRP
jgi:hypothetical protein